MERNVEVSEVVEKPRWGRSRSKDEKEENKLGYKRLEE